MQFSVIFSNQLLLGDTGEVLLERNDYSLRLQCPSIFEDDYLIYITQSYSIILVGQSVHPSCVTRAFFFERSLKYQLQHTVLGMP